MEISNDLKETVRTHENIDKVYFDGAGRHYLNPVEMDGRKYGNLVGGRPELTSVIVSTISRSEILGKKEEKSKDK